MKNQKQKPRKAKERPSEKSGDELITEIFESLGGGTKEQRDAFAKALDIIISPRSNSSGQR